MGNMVMGIMDSGNSLCAIGKPGVFSMGMDFLERKGQARHPQTKDGNKTMYIIILTCLTNNH